MLFDGSEARSGFQTPSRETETQSAALASQRCRAVWEAYGIGTPRVAHFSTSILPHSLHLDHFFTLAEDGEVDAVILANPGVNTDFDKFRSASEYFLVPIINVSRRASHLADAQFIVDDPDSWNETAAVIRKFRMRRALLRESFRRPATPALRMLARIFVSDEDLTPLRSPQSRYFHVYRGFQDTRFVAVLAEALAEAGMLERRFVDRHMVCAKCRSHRMLAREECPSCRSAWLSNSAFVHHYSCAHCGPEEHYRQGSMLICPKCKKQLRHYGKDYDKPADVQLCGECGNATTEPIAAFICQDCTSKIDGEFVETVDIHAYSLSGYAVAGLASAPADGLSLATVAFDGLPPTLRKHIEASGRETTPTDDHRFVVRLEYEARLDIARQKGATAFEKLRGLFLDRLQGLLADVATVESLRSGDYVFVHSMSRDAFRKNLQKILEESQFVLSERLSPRFEIVWSAEGESPGE